MSNPIDRSSRMPGRGGAVSRRRGFADRMRENPLPAQALRGGRGREARKSATRGLRWLLGLGFGAFVAGFVYYRAPGLTGMPAPAFREAPAPVPSASLPPERSHTPVPPPLVLDQETRLTPAPPPAKATPEMERRREPDDAVPAPTPAGAGLPQVPQLPRYPGTETVFEQDSIAIYATADPVARVGRVTGELLVQQGWQGEMTAQNADMRHMTFRKGRAVLTAYITVAPGLGNRTSIQYDVREQ